MPRHPLQDAIRVASAISDHYGKQPTSPLDVAVALDMKPSSGPFRYLCGAALEGDDLRAKREALLQPRVVGEFLRKYNSSKVPAKNIGKNVLEAMGVPREATDRTFDLIFDGAQSLSLFLL